MMFDLPQTSHERVTPTDEFHQSSKQDSESSNALHHLLGAPDIGSSGRSFVVAQDIMIDLLQLHAQSTGGGGHGLSGVRAGGFARIAPPDAPRPPTIASKERRACDDEQRRQAGG